MTTITSAAKDCSVLSNPAFKLKDDFSKAAFKSLLDTELGACLVETILRTNPQRITIKKGSDAYVTPAALGKYKITLSALPSYTTYRRVDGAAALFELDHRATLEHELNHIFNYLSFHPSHVNPQFYPLSPFGNSEEIRVITEGEFSDNSFAKSLGSPFTRISHLGSRVSPFNPSDVCKSINERMNALREYICCGAEYDAIAISQTLDNSSIELTIMSALEATHQDREISLFPTGQDYSHIFKICSALAKEYNLILPPLALLYLCERINSLEQLKQLQAMGLDLHFKDLYQENCLFKIDPKNMTKEAFLEILNYLKDNHINLNISEISHRKFWMVNPPVDLEQLKMLAEAGLDLQQLDTYQESLLFFLNRSNRDYLPMVEYLINELKLPVNSQNAEHLTFWMINPPVDMSHLMHLKNLGADFSLPEYQGDSLLMYLSPDRRERLPIVNYLVKELNLPINFQDGLDKTFWMRYPSKDMQELRELKELGADFTLCDWKGRSLLGYLDPQCDDYLLMVEYLVKELHLPINSQDANNQAFWMLKPPIKKKQLKKLKELGANFALKDREGQTILRYLQTSCHGYAAMVEYLIKEVRLSINFSDEFGKTFWMVKPPLNLEQLQNLVELGAVIPTTGAEGEKFLIALGNNQDFQLILKFLVQKGIISPNALYGKKKRPLLFLWLRSDWNCGRRLKILKAFSELGSDLHITDFDRNNLLSYLENDDYSSKEMVDYLVSNGFRIPDKQFDASKEIISRTTQPLLY